MVVWTMWIIQRFQLNMPQTHKHNICRLKMNPSLTTGHHQSDCPSLLSDVFASLWYCYTSPCLSLHGMIYKLNLSLYKLRKEITILSKMLRFCCTWNSTFFKQQMTAERTLCIIRANITMISILQYLSAIIYNRIHAFW